MGIYEDWQIHTKTGFRPIKPQESRSGPHTNRTLYNNIAYKLLLKQTKCFSKLQPRFIA